MHDPIRLCLDLNVWCARFLADRKNRQGTAAQQATGIVATGSSTLGQVQLVISWGMLNRLRVVLEREFGAGFDEVNDFIAAIAGYARLGASASGPSLTLGGTGTYPLADGEDVHVLDTAIAGDADILVTANFRDFLPRHVEILAPERLARLRHPKGALLIAHPYIFRTWLEAGRVQLPE